MRAVDSDESLRLVRCARVSAWQSYWVASDASVDDARRHALSRGLSGLLTANAASGSGRNVSLNNVCQREADPCSWHPATAKVSER